LAGNLDLNGFRWIFFRNGEVTTGKVLLGTGKEIEERSVLIEKERKMVGKWQEVKC
jgi:hypothetical protein